MSVTEHLDSLKAKHLDLEHLIEQEEARPRPDDDKIHGGGLTTTRPTN